MRTPRGLTAEEAEAWARVASTVQPIAPRKPVAAPTEPPPEKMPAAPRAAAAAAPAKPRPQRPPAPAPAGPGLDSHWDRRFRAGAIEPDLTLDLHGHTLDSAHARLNGGLSQARAMGARVVLVIAGKPRAAEAADRAGSRGAIRAKLLDWLAAGPHGSSIAAVRAAHRRHGGEGAVYLVLKRRA